MNDPAQTTLRTPPAAGARPMEGPLTEWLLRGFALVIYGFAVWNIAGAWWQDRTRMSLLVLLLTEGYTLCLVLIARRASLRDMSLLSIVATGYAAYFFVLFEPKGTTHLMPEAVAVAIQFTGMAWQFASKYALGRSFGLLPARRSIVVAGPYRFVRHPIYFGYLIGHIGFLGANFSWRNLAVLAVLYAAQVWRIRREEAMLATSDEYRSYMSRVRWRLVPGVY